MTAAFVLGQYVNLSGKLVMRSYRTRLRKYLTSLNAVLVNAAEKYTDVIARDSLIKSLAEHLKGCNDNLLDLVGDTNDFNFISRMKNTTLYTAGSNRTTACDGEYVLNRHKERLLGISYRVRNVLVDGVHEFKNGIAPLALRILKSLQSRTTDDRGVIARITVLIQKLTNLHLNEVDKLFIVNHIALVQEYYDVRNTYLTGKQDVLTGLCHNTIGSCYYKNSGIHLSGTGDHVLYVVSMSGAVNVCVMSLLRLVLNVCGGNCDSTCLLFRCFIDLIECLCMSQTKSLSQNSSDSCRQCCLTMVNVSDGTDINMRLVSDELFLCHCC